MYLKNIVKHTKLITHHKWLVFKLCCKIGEPWRGFMHDWSKYSPTEFIESVKYYNGTHSPITEAKKANGYSKAWLHHKGRNRHHAEYWVDESAEDKTPIIPYKFAAEMICDKLSAGMTYMGDKFTKEYELEYWNKEQEKVRMNPKMKQYVTEVLTQIAENGIDKTLTKQNIRAIYKKYCE